MALFPLLLGLGGGALTFNYLAANRDIDALSIPSVSQRSFWSIFMLGAASGAWIGVTFGSGIRGVFDYWETECSFFFKGARPDPKSTDNNGIDDSSQSPRAGETHYAPRHDRRNHRSSVYNGPYSRRDSNIYE